MRYARILSVTFVLTSLILIKTSFNGDVYNIVEKAVSKVVNVFEKTTEIHKEKVSIVNLSILLAELLVLSLIIQILNKSRRREMQKLEDLIKQSKRTLKETNSYLDRWNETKDTYLGLVSKDLTLQVPLWHLPIIGDKSYIEKIKNNPPENVVVRKCPSLCNISK